MAVAGYKGSIWDRFWSKVDSSGGADACWPWVGAKSVKRSGTLRGVLQVAGRRSRIVLAHRFALCLVFGGLALDELLAEYDALFDDGSRREACHRCNNRLCCNPHPNHLYWGTQEQNRADRYRVEAA